MNIVASIRILSGATFMMYSAGRVKIDPATTSPEAAPMLWMITFSRIELRRLPNMPDTPTARMPIGMAASNTWATFNPE